MLLAKFCWITPNSRQQGFWLDLLFCEHYLSEVLYHLRQALLLIPFADRFSVTKRAISANVFYQYYFEMKSENKLPDNIDTFADFLDVYFNLEESDAYAADYRDIAESVVRDILYTDLGINVVNSKTYSEEKIKLHLTNYKLNKGIKVCGKWTNGNYYSHILPNKFMNFIDVSSLFAFTATLSIFLVMVFAPFIMFEQEASKYDMAETYKSITAMIIVASGIMILGSLVIGFINIVVIPTRFPPKISVII